MILSRRAAYGGEQLDEVHEAIVIRSIDPGIPRERIQAEDMMGGWGQTMTGQHWESLDASVTFAINVPKRQLKLRSEIFDAVLAWANRPGKWLKFSTMPDRRLYVDKIVLPGRGDMWDWTKEYTITFRAYGVPFWESAEPGSVTINKISSGTVNVDVGGTAPSVLDLKFQNISGSTITDFEIKYGDTDMKLSGVNIGSGETLSISHPSKDGGKLKILCQNSGGSRSVYSTLRGNDDLVVETGTVAVEIISKRAGKLTIENYARWF